MDNVVRNSEEVVSSLMDDIMGEIVRGCEDTDEEEDIDVSRIGREGEINFGNQECEFCHCVFEFGTDVDNHVCPYFLSKDDESRKDQEMMGWDDEVRHRQGGEPQFDDDEDNVCEHCHSVLEDIEDHTCPNFASSGELDSEGEIDEEQFFDDEWLISDNDDDETMNKEHENDGNQRQCNDCGEKFRTITALMDHIEAMHGLESDGGDYGNQGTEWRRSGDGMEWPPNSDLEISANVPVTLTVIS